MGMRPAWLAGPMARHRSLLMAVSSGESFTGMVAAGAPEAGGVPARWAFPVLTTETSSTDTRGKRWMVMGSPKEGSCYGSQFSMDARRWLEGKGVRLDLPSNGTAYFGAASGKSSLTPFPD